MFCTLILLPYIKTSNYNRTDNNFGTSSDNSASNTEFPDSENFRQGAKKKVSDKNYTQH